MDGNFRPLLAMQSELENLFGRVNVQPRVIRQYSEPVESSAGIIDNYIDNVLAGECSKLIIAPAMEDIDPTARNYRKSDNPGDKHYITVQQLLVCIAGSQNAIVLRELDGGTRGHVRF
jgi:hypothetical protein